MRKFYTQIVHHRKLVIFVFILITAICAILQNFVRVNYDVNDYLPADSHSTVSLEIMEEEFDSGIPSVRVMIKDVTVPEALEYKSRLQEIKGVTEVNWLDDNVDITLPLQMMPQEIVDSYYIDDNAIFSVTINEEQRVEVVDAIRAMVGEENALTGSSVSTAVATTSTVTEVAKIAAFAVLFVLIVLIFTTESWFEPVVVLCGLGVAILINNGTNLLFGEISFITNAAGSVLQLAVSLDYSVFLIHRFVECRAKESDEEVAMIDALCESTGSILSSGLTTVIGFLALVMMQFQIGPDLGFVLAKGVALSLITVFVFMSAFILVTYKLIEKTKHRSFVPDFHRFGNLVRKIKIPMACLFCVMIVPAYLGSNANSYYYGVSHMFGEETQLGAETAEIEEIFGKSDTYVLMVPNSSTATEVELSEELHTIPQVTGIISYVDMAGAEIPKEYLDENTLNLLVSENYSRMVINVEVDYEGEEAFALVEQIREIADKYYPGSYYLAGQGVSTYDLMDTITADMVKVNFVAIAAVFLVLLVLQKNVVLPTILVLSIETAVWMNLSVQYFAGNTVFYMAYLIISSVQLGATVDYAILLSERYMDYRKTMNKKQAVVETIASVTISVLTSGSVLSVVGFLLGYISTNEVLAQLGIFLGIGGVCSIIIVLFALPGLLYIFDRFFIKKPKNI